MRIMLHDNLPENDIRRDDLVDWIEEDLFPLSDFIDAMNADDTYDRPGLFGVAKTLQDYSYQRRGDKMDMLEQLLGRVVVLRVRLGNSAGLADGSMVGLEIENLA